MRVASFVEELVGAELPVAVVAYDGSEAGPSEAAARIVIKSPAALARLALSPSDLGMGRAYAAGDLEVEGDIFAALALAERLPNVRLTWHQWASAARMASASGLHLPGPVPGEVRLHGRRHSRRRDLEAIRHHYDVSDRFYRLVLGPSMTYSCALWADPGATLEQAQAAKLELVCRKLGLRPGMRLLDVGCGWGAMALHAASNHGVEVVGVTLSRNQAEWGRREAAAAGLAERVDIRFQDYRDVRDGPFDAISSIGMFEHVGPVHLRAYFDHLFSLLRPGGRLLNHGITRPRPDTGGHARATFVDRFVFPDGELVELGEVVSTLHAAGFEARHAETLREHYAKTLRAWVANLDRSWDEAVAEAGAHRARIWKLYMAASAMNFECNRSQVHQVLAVRSEGGDSGMPLWPPFRLSNLRQEG